MPKSKTPAALVIALGMGAPLHMAFSRKALKGEPTSDTARRLLLESLRDTQGARVIARDFLRARWTDRTGQAL